MSNFCIYAAAASAEIGGCFAFWAWLRLSQPTYWLMPGVVLLVIFALLLTRISSDFAGCTFAAYGGIYIAASLLWMWGMENNRPVR